MASRFGVLLRQWRQRAGLSQEGLAQRAELGVRTIRGLETGERGDPRVGTLRLLADALELTGAERAELFAAAGRAEPVPDEPSATEPHTPGSRASSSQALEPRTSDLPAAQPSGDDTGLPAPHADPLVNALKALAHSVRARWRREEEQRQVHDPVPLPVRWRPAPAPLQDSWANIGMAGPGETAPRLDLGGRLDQVVGTYRRIPSCRLVVLGRAGAGKTVLTTRFVLGLLDARGPDDPVPVIFGLGSWNPTRTGLRDWLAEQLVRDDPDLAAPGPGGSTLAAALVDDHRVLPVLDGFDEMAGGLRRAALAALNATTLPMLLTSRVDEYRAAVDATDVLTGAAAVELVDLTADDLADYLPRTTRKTGRAGNAWQPVLDEVRRHPGGALAAVLTTPLMVSLARRIYSDTPDHDPADLLDADRFGTRESIERHLLAGFVPAVYQDPGADRTPDVDRTRRWLGHLADHLHRLGTYDLAWWRLGTSTGRATRALVVGFVVCAVVSLTDMLVEGALVDVSAVRMPALAVMVGLVAGLGFGLAHGHVVGGQPLEPVRVRLRLRGRPEPGWARVRARGRLGLLFGALVGCVYGVLRKVAQWLVLDLPVTPMTAVVDTVLFGTVFGLGAGSVLALITALEAPLDVRSAGSPTGLLRANRRTVLVQVVLFVPLFAVLVMGLTWLVVQALVALPGDRIFGVTLVWTPLNGLVLGLVCGLGGGIGYVLGMTAWGQWLVFARLWLPLTGRLPWAVHAFLDDAYRRGVLRRAGAVYQFRHARLQDHLAETYRRQA
ncbi:NACHT domain-containing protein [Saccharothrix syringae]|uniref:XRE family transcriptional regulator n=1 Tax=Saccharothrix syringae TaxID=103733 RepID=A0A5Q0H090_SACSY|nr:helix-turn-helix transcriptional regulator [Saccharothrix syringae]QFZ19599.1 XRE family transcriptional regulator [Saccharothrix syringae]